ncbi:MAG: hypothetical protein PHU14_08395 [Methylovulum sp.]|nr:hypothetical protein [Methylovulum sp.]
MSRYRDDFLIGFSHPKARYFLLLRQKKVSKEKAARLPLHPALLGFVGGRQKGLPALLPPRGILAAPLYALRVFGLIPTKPAVLGAANGSKTALLRNVGDALKSGKIPRL